jgi:hypothetical protein
MASDISLLRMLSFVRVYTMLCGTNRASRNRDHSCSPLCAGAKNVLVEKVFFLFEKIVEKKHEDSMRKGPARITSTINSQRKPRMTKVQLLPLQS